MAGNAQAHAVDGRAGDDARGSPYLPQTVRAAVVGLWGLVPLAWRLVSVAALGAAAAAAVGYVTSRNPWAAPAHIAVTVRVLIIVTLIAAGVYAQTSKIQARMGGLLIAVGFFSALWLLNGSSDRLLFSIGALCAGPAPVLFAYLLLAHPTGRLRSPTERRFLWRTGGVLTALWTLAFIMTRQPPLKTPLLRCTPHCPSNVFSLGSATDDILAVKVALVLASITLALGTAVLLYRRARTASDPVRHSLTPIWLIATVSAALLGAYLISLAAGLRMVTAIGAAYVEVAIAVPIAILIGLGIEQLFVAQALADFVNQLGQSPKADPEDLMAGALRDHSLRIAYRRPGLGTYVDSSGLPIAKLPRDRAITWIERDRLPVAAVIYNSELADQERFLQAAGAAALMRLEKAQLETDLKASAADLAASRGRLMEMAHAERRRLERDLHDGVQQQLVGLRIKLDLAADTIKQDPLRGERMLASVGEQMDDVLHGLRLLARGIYPSVLHERGLAEALRSAARSSPVATVVRGTGVGRYAEDVEVAVYFCCLEGLQNVVKHAGPGANATITLREDGQRLRFEVRDSGVGFDVATAPPGTGLTNMRDRIEAVDGTLAITSTPGHGTLVAGSVPVE